MVGELHSTDIEAELLDLESISEKMLSLGIITQQEFDTGEDLVNKFIAKITDYRAKVGDNWSINPTLGVKTPYLPTVANFDSLTVNLRLVIIQMFDEGEINTALRNQMNSRMTQFETLRSRL